MRHSTITKPVLSAERDELAQALAAAQEAEAEARAVADTVSARLDTAIDRLQTVLED